MDAEALGRYLRENREARELTLDEAEQALRIRRRVLEAFEQGQFELAESSPIQVRGFLSNYARFLNLDEERILQYYEMSRQVDTRRTRRRSKKKSSDTELRAARSVTDTDPALPAVPLGELSQQRRSQQFALLNRIVIVLAGIAALAIIAFVVVQLFSSSQPEIEIESDVPILLAQSPQPVNTLVPTFTPLADLIIATAIPRVAQDFSGNGVLVTIEATQRTWLQFLSDGNEQYVGIMRPGDVVEFPAQSEIVVTASNARALLVTWNGQPQGTLGGRGQRVDITFTVNNISISSGPGFEPTSAFSPTPLPTSAIDVGALIAAQTPSPTPGPSPTPSNTPTPSDTPTITPTPSDTPTITLTPSITPTASDTPTATATPTITLTPSPTAILPPRVTQEGLPPTKSSG